MQKMMDNYLQSAMDAQKSYHDTVARCLHTLMGDVFLAHPEIDRVQVGLDYTPHPPYSCSYIMRGAQVDLGCGWVEVDALMPTSYNEDIGKLLQFIYTHAPAIVLTKGMGQIAWCRLTYNL